MCRAFRLTKSYLWSTQQGLRLTSQAGPAHGRPDSLVTRVLILSLDVLASVNFQKILQRTSSRAFV